jgi:hypothetical protein
VTKKPFRTQVVEISVPQVRGSVPTLSKVIDWDYAERPDDSERSNF